MNTLPRALISSQTGSQYNSNPTTFTTHSLSTSSSGTLFSSSTPVDNHTPANVLSSKNANNKLNYALATANFNTPKREQAIVLHPIDGILLKDYISLLDKLFLPTILYLYPKYR